MELQPHLEGVTDYFPLVRAGTNCPALGAKKGTGSMLLRAII